MHFCLRVDLDYVPWDTPDADEFGHGEPATLLHLLHLGASRDLAFQFYASNRVLHAFPAAARTVLERGHALGWLCKHPEQMNGRLDDARRLFSELGQTLTGMAVRSPWVEGMPLPDGLLYVSAPSGPAPPKVNSFPIEIPSDREAFRAGHNAIEWVTAVKNALSLSAEQSGCTTVCVRPQVLAKFDRRLRRIDEILAFGVALGLRFTTHRELAEGGFE